MHFGALIIGDEILSGKRTDRHFAKLAALLGERGLRLSWVEYLGDDRARIAATLRRTLASGISPKSSVNRALWSAARPRSCISASRTL